ncbi:MAG: alpha/beta hydrolase [Planctomycetes bacterium]|nr:alpha/beta hydrolase [Planctomycetota bacterium]
MRRAFVNCVLLLGLLTGATVADEPSVYRGQTAAEWLPQLSHPSASARAAAAQAFVNIGRGNEDAVAPLSNLLSDRDERVRFYAAFALGKIETDQERCITALIEALSDDDEHVRYTAQWSLAQIAKQVAASIEDGQPVNGRLASVLADAQTHLRASGALPGHLNQVRAAIARFEGETPELIVAEPHLSRSNGVEDDVTRFLSAITSDDTFARVKAIGVLPKLGPEAVERLLALPDVVANLGPLGGLVQRAIASLGEPVIPVLLQTLRSSSDETSFLAANTLREMGPDAAVALPDLIDMLKDEDSSDTVLEQTIWVLTRIRSSAGPAADDLVRILNDDGRDESVRRIAAEALGSIGADAKHAIPDLIANLKDADVAPFLRIECSSTLARLDPNSEKVTQALVVAFNEMESIFDAIGIAENLCDCGPGANAIVPRLMDAVDETSFDQRRSVVELLGKLGGTSIDVVSPLLVERLMDPTEELIVRVAAAKALGNFGPRGVQLVVDQFESGHEAEQLTAARALIEIGAEARSAKQALLGMLRESQAKNELRSLAAVALGQLGAEANDATLVLTELLRDTESDDYLRAMCAVALGQIDPSAVPIIEETLDDAVAEVQIAAAYALCKRDANHARGLETLVHWLQSDEHRGSAISALIDVGETSLSHVLEKMNDTSQSPDTRVSCLEVLSAFDDRAIAPLLQALNDEMLAEEAGWTLRDRGNELLPTLVTSIENESIFTPQARAVMRNVVEDMFAGLGAGGDFESWQGGHALVHREEFEWSETSAAGSAAPSVTRAEPFEATAMEPEPVENYSPVEEVESAEAEVEISESPTTPEGYVSVDVYYGTNREPIDQTPDQAAGDSQLYWAVAIGALLGVVTYLIGMYRRGTRRQALAGLAGATLLLLFGLVIFAPTRVRPEIDKTGPRYGGEYTDRVEMGVCEVTIPDTHREGELEAPTLLEFQVAEDLQKHIVLRSVRRMEPDAFFGGLRREMQSKGNHILVFVHGFNVSFDDAARRTAQMASDLKFAGAPVFYSWPSQADWWKYRIDEKNVELSVDQLKTFLLAIAERSEADTINLVAHSMGNRALTEALKEIDVAANEREQMFNQVILAAPDIDADIFKQRIAPAIVTKAKHITLYASSNDWALDASRKFNSGDPRAGDAGEGLVVVPGIETIDVSSGDSSLLGHSYYGNNVSVLRDIEFILRDQPADTRRFLEPMTHSGDLIYWTFRPDRITRQPTSLPRSF